MQREALLQAHGRLPALNSSESVSWPGKTIMRSAPKFEDELVDCTYFARYYEGEIQFEMSIPSFVSDTSALTIDATQCDKRGESWGEIRTPGYRRKRRMKQVRLLQKKRDRL
jgi:hypothetical protein